MDIPFKVHAVHATEAVTKGEVLGRPQGVKVSSFEVDLVGVEGDHGAVQHGAMKLRFWQPDEIEEAQATFIVDEIVIGSFAAATKASSAPAAASAAPAEATAA